MPDLVVGYEGRNWLFEVKDPSKPPSERKLTDAQHEFFTTWRGQVRQILTADDAFKDGHRVGVLLSYEATHAQLGRRVRVRELQLYRVANGKISERWYAADRRAARGEA